MLNSSSNRYTQRLYKELLSFGNDATGSIVYNFEHTSLNKSSDGIFLNETVINTGYSQISVSQMIFERHDTLTIFYWLSQWLKSAIEIPNEDLRPNAILLCTLERVPISPYQNILRHRQTLREFRQLLF